MAAYYCPSCYGRKKYCQKCKSFHCPPDGCTWNRPCPGTKRAGKPKPQCDIYGEVPNK